MRPATDEERKRLGVPPAYTNVRISDDPNADLRAVATTPKGKTFYLYSKAFRARNDAKKWTRVRKLNAKMEKVEARIDRDAQAGNGIAICARLILQTGLRNGGEPQGDKPSFGASSLLLEHCSVHGNVVRLQFPGKHAVPQDVKVEDAMFAAYVRSRSGEVKLFDHDASQTLRYMKSVGAAKVHDLRTWRANVLAQMLVEELLKLEKPTSAKARKIFQKAVAERVAEVLGNKPAQALKSYIDPKVWEPLGEE